MTTPTPAELALIRSRPHAGKIWLSIYQPPVVFCAQVTGTYGQGLNAVPYIGVVTGSYTNIVAGQTLLLGTTPYGRDVGKIRVRSATASTITVAENYHINWLDGLYLTVIDFHEVWPIFPRMTTSSGNTIWYKDYDIPYGGQNSTLGSFINMGPHYAGFISGGAAQVYYSASGSVNLLGLGVLYSWQFPGGSPAWYSGSEPGMVNYATPGQYTTALQVTASNGVVEHGYRHVSIYDRPGQGPHTPVLRWGLSSFDGSRANGGWSAKIWMRDNIASVVDGALCIFFVDADYGGVGQTFGGNAPNRSSILFVGYINGETIHYDWEKSYVEFEIQSVTGLMKELECFSVALNSVASPGYWYEMLDMDSRRAIYHYLRWQTTVLDIADVEFRNFNDLPIAYFDADKTSLYDAINNFVQSTLMGLVVSDRQGKIWVEQDAGIIPDASGSVAIDMQMDRQDWAGEPYFNYQDHDRLSYVELGGIAYSGATTGTNTALLSGAPGAYVPRYGGLSQSLSGLALASQVQLNVLSGDWLAWNGSRLGEIEMSLMGDYRNIDIAPQEQLLLSINPTDTVKGITWSAKQFIPSRLTMKYDPSKQVILWDMSIRELTKGLPGTTIDIPPVPADTLSDWQLPNWTLPGFPPVVMPPTPTDEIQTCYVVGMLPIGGQVIRFGIGRTDNFQDVSPTWRNVTPTNITGTNAEYYSDFCVDPWDPQHAAYLLNTHDGLYYVTDLNTAFPVYTLILSSATIQAAMRATGGGHADETIEKALRVKASSFVAGSVAVLMSTHYGGTYFVGWLLTRASYSSAWNYWSISTTDGRLYFDENNGLYQGLTTPPMDMMDPAKYAYPIFMGGARASDNQEMVVAADSAGNMFATYIASGSNSYKREPGNIHISRCPAAQSRVVWVMGGGGSGGDAYIQQSIDFGATWHDKTYTALHGYGDGGGQGYRNAELKTYFGDYTDILALVVRSSALRGTEAPHLISSINHGNTWTVQKMFLRSTLQGAGSMAVRCLERHPYNPNRCYLVGNYLDGHILASADRGKTWHDKLGNWPTIFTNWQGTGGVYYPDCNSNHTQEYMSFLFPVW
jgi:hypothetical protein